MSAGIARPLLDKLLEEVASEGFLECRDCGDALEPDAPECHCGWSNPLVREGLV